LKEDRQDPLNYSNWVMLRKTKNNIKRYFISFKSIWISN